MNLLKQENLNRLDRLDRQDALDRQDGLDRKLSQAQAELGTLAQLHQPAPVTLYPAKITSQFSDEGWLLDDVHQACRAFSCIVKPHVGDQVLYACCAGQNQIVAILNRVEVHNEEPANLSLPEQQSVLFEADSLDFFGKNKLTISSYGNIEINALIGKLMCSARDILQSIQQSFVQISKQVICRTEHLDVSASKLSKSHARHQIITADKEMKVDAERINMG